MRKCGCDRCQGRRLPWNKSKGASVVLVILAVVAAFIWTNIGKQEMPSQLTPYGAENP